MGLSSAAFVSFANGFTVGEPKLNPGAGVTGLCANKADAVGVDAVNEKLRVGLSGAFPLPFTFISLVGLSSMLTSCSTLGGVAGRAGVVGANKNVLVDTSVPLLPLDGVPNVKVGVDVVVGVVALKENVEAGLVSLAGCAGAPPNENGLEAGFSSFFAVSPRENVDAGLASLASCVGTPPNENRLEACFSSFFVASLAAGAPNENGADDPPKSVLAVSGCVGAAEGVGCPKENAGFGASVLPADTAGVVKPKLKGAAGLVVGGSVSFCSVFGGSARGGGDGSAALAAPNEKGGARLDDGGADAAPPSLLVVVESEGPNKEVVPPAGTTGALNSEVTGGPVDVEVEGAPKSEVPLDAEDAVAPNTVGEATGS